MLTSITISNYRGIKNCEVKGLDRINVFIGRNGSGKSSILEALYLTRLVINNKSLMPRGPQTLLNHILEKHGYRRNKSLSELWYKYETENMLIYIYLMWLDKRAIRVRMDYNNESITTLINEKPLPYEININSQFFVRYEEFPTLPKDFTKENYNYLKEICLMDDIISRALNEIEENDFKNLKLKDLDRELLKILNEVYKTNYTSIEYLPDEHRNYRISFLEPNIKRRLYYDELPDGVKYGFAYLIRAMNLEGSALLIEELENHQHPGSIEKLLEALFEIAVKKNVQIFISTHSMEVFNNTIDLSHKYPIKLFHVRKEKEEISVKEIKQADAELLISMEVDIVKLEDSIDKMIEGLKKK